MSLPHFLNYRNSCAVDSLLDLSFYCFEQNLKNGNVSNRGPLSVLLYDVNTQRKVKNECPRSLREPVWDWLCSNVQSFAVKGSTDPAISDTFPHLVTSFEKNLFGVVIKRSYQCSICSSVDCIPDRVLCPVILMTDDISNGSYDIQKAIEVSIANLVMPTRACLNCNLHSSVLKSSTVTYPECVIVQVPVVAEKMHTVEDVQMPEEVIDLTKSQDSAHSNDKASKLHSKRQDENFHVLPNISVHSSLQLQNEFFNLCAAVKCHKCHFSIAVKNDGSFFDVDGCKVNTQQAKSFSLLTGQNHGDIYHTRASDGYFIFIYIKQNNLSDFQSCDGISMSSTCSQLQPKEMEFHGSSLHTDISVAKSNLSNSNDLPVNNKLHLSEHLLELDRKFPNDSSSAKATCEGSNFCSNVNSDSDTVQDQGTKNREEEISKADQCAVSPVSANAPVVRPIENGQTTSKKNQCTPSGVPESSPPVCRTKTDPSLSKLDQCAPSEVSEKLSLSCPTQTDPDMSKPDPCTPSDVSESLPPSEVPEKLSPSILSQTDQDLSKPDPCTPAEVPESLPPVCQTKTDLNMSKLDRFATLEASEKLSTSSPTQTDRDLSKHDRCTPPGVSENLPPVCLTKIDLNLLKLDQCTPSEVSEELSSSCPTQTDQDLSKPDGCTPSGVSKHLPPACPIQTDQKRLNANQCSSAEVSENSPPICPSGNVSMFNSENIFVNSHEPNDLSRLFHLVGKKPFCSILTFYESVSLEIHCRRRRNIDSFLCTRGLDSNVNIISCPYQNSKAKVSASVFFLYAFRNSKSDLGEELRCKRNMLQENICSFIGKYIGKLLETKSQDVNAAGSTGFDGIHTMGSFTLFKNSIPYIPVNLIEELLEVKKGNSMWVTRMKILQWELDEKDELCTDIDKLVATNTTMYVTWKVVFLLALSAKRPSDTVSSFLLSLCEIFERCIVIHKQRSPLTAVDNNSNRSFITSKSHFPLLKKETKLLLNKAGTSNTKKLMHNKYVTRRLKEQKAALKDISEKIHGKGKENLKAALQYDIQNEHVRTHRREEEFGWDGSLSASDFLDILDGVSSRNPAQSVLDEFCQSRAADSMKLSAEEIISMVDNRSGYDIISQLHKRFPGFFPSSYQIKKTKKLMFREYQVIMQPLYVPEQTHAKCGIRINPERLLTCLRYLYYYLPKVEWWKLWGDGRDIGGRSSCLLTISNINNEQVLHGIDVHSPCEIWPLAVFYGNDHRWNLEANLGSSGQHGGWLDAFVKKEQEGLNDSQKSSLFFLSGDSAFLDAVYGVTGEFSPLSKSGFNLYIKESKDTIGKTDNETGFRSDVNKSFNRTYPNALIPSIPIERVVFCIDHAATRVVEKMIQLRLKSIAKVGVDIKPSSVGKNEMQRKLVQFKQNCLARGIRKVNRIEIAPDGTLKERLTLNKSEAHTILFQPEEFINDYPSIIDGVASNDMFFQVDKQCQNALNLTSNKLSEFDLENLIWKHLSEGIMLLRKSDPKPPERREDSEYCNFSAGLTPIQINRLKTVFDIFHKLFVTRYGASELTPYMVKLIDVTHLLLNKLPIPSLMRFSIEGGEHSHYTQSCFYYQHTQRGGGPKTHDPITSLLFWAYRRLRARIMMYGQSPNKGEQETAKQFRHWVKREVAANLIQKTVRGFLTRRRLKCKRFFNSPPEPDSCLHTAHVILVGRLPKQLVQNFETKENLCTQLSMIGLKARSADLKLLPPRSVPFSLIVVTKQSDCDVESPSKVLLEAVSRKWSIVSYDYILECLKQKNCLQVEPRFLINLDKLKEHPQCKVYHAFSHFEKPSRVRPLTEVKRKRRRPVDDSDKSSKAVKVPRRPQSGYAYFFSQNFSNLEGTMQDKHYVLKKKWQDLPAEEALQWKNQAYTKYNKENCSKRA